LSEQPSEVVFIQADTKAKHGVVVKVMDQVKEAGIDRVAIAVRG
jgi:biopolymer transport protein ExbD